MENGKLILVINPGSTSTKVAVFRDKAELSSETLEHSQEELRRFPAVVDQLEFRKEAVRRYIDERGLRIGDFSAIAARGGVIGALESGAYLVDELFAHASRTTHVPHAANLASVIGYELVKESGADIPTFVYDAVCGCGKPEEIFTLTGMAAMERPFLTHVLNTRAVSIRQAEEDGVPLAETIYIVVHMGGGVTTNLVCGGKITDIVADDEGGFSPERSGGVPCRKLVRMCYSGKYTETEMQRMLKGEGGMLSYLGTSDLRRVEEMIAGGSRRAEIVYQAMAMQLSKDICSLAAVVCGKVDKIILTGGLAYSEKFTGLLRERTGFLAPVSVIPGSMEMQALAFGALRVLNGEEAYHTFRG